MLKQIILKQPAKNFESSKKINKNGIEYWEARELMPLLGYNRWENFIKVVNKAQDACEGSKQAKEDHFRDVTKMVKLGSGSMRQVKDHHLSRYACYLIAQNGDPRKLQISIAQTYFAIQTRKQELFQELSENKKRLLIRGEVKEHNKELFSTAQKAGVSNFGKFNNYGYLGLYELKAEQIKRKKRIGQDDILDRAGATELAANLFRITQTDAKIKKEEMQGAERASATHYNVGQKVRKTIKEIGGTMPEDLEPEKHIKELERTEKKVLNKNKFLK
ncbi:DNA damage-inducible protein D [bacterium]|mgnify:CR=1 FL=1|nr:DNA damage-inducible protein D [bacterium]|tara:strand:- start:4409 stop:5233 length:825 start_codon:yes stop_codon:yes gene_type:complete